MPPTILQFTALPSLTHPSFWHRLTELKLDVLKLSDDEVPISGTYGVGRQVKDRETGTWVGMDGSMAVEDESFSAETRTHPSGSVAAPGIVKNYNTIEEFKAADKTKLFNDAADKIWDSIISTRSPALLNSFLIITYADLKKYKYYYWFAFPAFVASPAWHIADPGWSDASSTFTPDQLLSIHAQLLTRPLPYFLVHAPDADSPTVTVAPISDYAQLTASGALTIAFIDPSTQPQNPGWPLRNLLAFLRTLHPDTTAALRVLSWRDADPPRGEDGWKSRVGTVVVSDTAVVGNTGMGDTVGAEAGKKRPGAVGWEKNVHGKLGPRVADLAPMMDPARLANQAVDLNLKLMRWRIMPSLNLDKIAQTKCLLLGAGTLGCYVARCLMGWGVRTITLLDSGRVSFSNPVRQPLFQFTDCLAGGRPKAECAAERLREVWPGLNATGHTLAIPMPGHPIPAPNLEQTKADVAKLEKLIEEHDVVYLLMDSRESRWLPTVLGRARGKLVMNAALGFDTFLVMRHGARPVEGGVNVDAGVKEGVEEGVKEGKPPRVPRVKLGCYYCNDIVAPADSLTDRTLDQMCTVTRPGLASIAASTAVELMVSVLQHPEGIHAPAPRPPTNQSSNQSSNPNPNQSSSPGDEEEGTTALGLIPHQLRGYLAQFRNMHIVGAAYERCTGCSDTVLDAYATEGFPMLLKAFNDPAYLEQLTGLDKLFAEGEKALQDVEWLEEEEGSDGF